MCSIDVCLPDQLKNRQAIWLPEVTRGYPRLPGNIDGYPGFFGAQSKPLTVGFLSIISRYQRNREPFIRGNLISKLCLC